MSNDVQQVEREMKEQFERAGLLPYLVEDASEIYDLDGELFVDVVLSDRAHIDQAGAVMNNLLSGSVFSLVVRSMWLIDQVSDPVPAYAQDGGLRAASLISITLRSGTEETVVTVAVTKLAEMEFGRILGARLVDLKRVAKLVVESALRRGGRSYWDPTVDDYLEVASGAVANISQMLRQTA